MGNLTGSLGQGGTGQGQPCQVGQNPGNSAGPSGLSPYYYLDPSNPYFGLGLGQLLGTQNQGTNQQPATNTTPPQHCQGNYPQHGFNQGYPQQPNTGVSPAASMAQTACCGACISCLSSLLCSCCQSSGGGGGLGGGGGIPIPGIGVGGGGVEGRTINPTPPIRDDVGDDGYGIPETANVTPPHTTNHDGI